jgi:HPt (histidine-containing phosphotransfer) domain-containing protein
MTQENEPLLDMNVVNQLLQHRRNGQSAFERLLPVFLEEAGMLVEQMRCALSASDLEGLRLTAHKLKGGASVLGASGIRAVAQEIMNAAGAGTLLPESIREAEKAVGLFAGEAERLLGR